MTDIDKIKWREVDYDEYGQSHYRTPRRVTQHEAKTVRYELGSTPTELPTKPGAVVAPVAPNNEDFAPYVLSPSGEWYELDSGYGVTPYTVGTEEIIDFIDEGTFYIAYGGYDV